MKSFFNNFPCICREEAKELQSQDPKSYIPLTSDDIPASIKRYNPAFGFKDCITLHLASKTYSNSFLVSFYVLCEIKHFVTYDLSQLKLFRDL